jgi:Arc/MetJ-type ribon-helix-helix transcriptional regulator
MTISLTPKQEARLQQLLETKQFKSVEDFIDSSLDAVTVDEEYVESEAFAAIMRKKIKASEKDIDEGRIYSFKKGELIKEIQRHGRERLELEKKARHIMNAKFQSV